MASSEEAVAIIKTLMPNGCTVQEWCDYLDDTSTVWKVSDGEEVWSFYTIAQDGYFGEGHAYIFKAHRKRSKVIIKLMVMQVKAMGLIPKTSATSDFPHVVKFLKMLGFTEVGVEKGGIIKSTGPVDVTYLLYFN